MALVYLSLGSNVGDRGAVLRRAIAALPAATRGRVLRVSRLYETAPWGVRNQPSFLNLALALDTPLAPRDLLAALKEMEAAAGRTAGPRWGPRPLDLDMNDQALTIPHPRLAERRFVLQPLADIWPAGAPLLDRSLPDLLRAVADQDVTPVSADQEGGL